MSDRVSSPQSLQSVHRTEDGRRFREAILTPARWLRHHGQFVSPLADLWPLVCLQFGTQYMGLGRSLAGVISSALFHQTGRQRSALKTTSVLQLRIAACVSGIFSGRLFGIGWGGVASAASEIPWPIPTSSACRAGLRWEWPWPCCSDWNDRACLSAPPAVRIYGRPAGPARHLSDGRHV